MLFSKPPWLLHVTFTPSDARSLLRGRSFAKECLRRSFHGTHLQRGPGHRRFTVPPCSGIGSSLNSGGWHCQGWENSWRSWEIRKAVMFVEMNKATHIVILYIVLTKNAKSPSSSSSSSSSSESPFIIVLYHFISIFKRPLLKSLLTHPPSMAVSHSGCRGWGKCKGCDPTGILLWPSFWELASFWFRSTQGAPLPFWLQLVPRKHDQNDIVDGQNPAPVEVVNSPSIVMI